MDQIPDADLLRPLGSAKGAGARHQIGKELASSWSGALDTAAILRDLERLWPNRAHESNWLKGLLCGLGLHLWHRLDVPGADTSILKTRYCRWCPKVEIVGSAKGGDARPEDREGVRRSWRGVLNTSPVLRGFVRSAKGGDARPKDREGIRRSWRGVLNTSPVLRGLVSSAKGGDARPETAKEIRRSWRGVLDTSPVLRGFVGSAKGAEARPKDREGIRCS